MSGLEHLVEFHDRPADHLGRREILDGSPYDLVPGAPPVELEGGIAYLDDPAFVVQDRGGEKGVSYAREEGFLLQIHFR